MTTKKPSVHVSNTSTSSSPAHAPAPTAPAPAPAPVVAPLTPATVAQCSTLLAQVVALLGPVKQLSKTEIMRSLKLRKGGAQVVNDLLALCRQHGVTSVGPITLDGLSAMNDRAAQLNEIGVAFDKAQKVVGDATFSAETVTWQYATAMYTVLQRLALMDQSLALALQPVVAFFQTKTTKGKQRTNNALRTVKKGKEAEAKLIASGKLPAHAEPSPPANAGANGGNGSAPAAAPAPTATNGVAHS